MLDELDAGGPRRSPMVGEPGIGKTRLLAELAERADGARHLVLAGSASELERDVPFWVFVDALDEYVRGLDPRCSRRSATRCWPSSPRSCPACRRVAAPRRPRCTHERYRIHRAVRALLERLAAHRPLVLVLDDLHWADSGSLELCWRCCAGRRPRRVLIALGDAPAARARALATALERALRSGRLTRLELGAADADEADALLERRRRRRAADALYAESGGNPFYLEQLARSLGRDAAAATAAAAAGGIEVPAAVAAALAEELGAAARRTRASCCEGAAVAGEPFEPELAAAAAGTERARRRWPRSTSC